MHYKLLNKYYFIKSLDTNNFKKQDKQTTIIYRNYSSSKIDVNKLLKFKIFLKKKGNKFLLSNNFKLALKLRLDGVYLPSFNKELNHLSYSTFANFIILGSAHNIKEIRLKEKQSVEYIFISSLFKNNKNYLGFNKFNNLKKLTKKKIIALGGVSKSNLKQVKLLNCSGFSGIRYFE